MRKFTDEQVKKINEAREKVLDKLDIFKLGLLFPETYARQEVCSRKHWLEVVRLRIETLDCQKCICNGRNFSDYTDFEVGMMVEEYFADIREIFMQEFGKIIPPFVAILAEYQTVIIEVFKNQ